MSSCSALFGETLKRALFLVSISGVLVLAACGRGEPPPPPPPPPGTIPAVPGQPGVPGQPVVPGQPGQPGANGSNFGTFTLTPGFTPDPHAVSGTSGGAVNATSLNAACRGFVSSQPDHIFVAAGVFNLLRFLVNGGSGDTTLVIQRPDGTYSCDDDSEGRNPIVQGAFPPGAYKIWIGSYSQGESVRYNLGVSELTATTVASLGAPGAGGAAPGGMASNFGTVTLSPGFTPDPHKVSGRAGGAISADTLSPACRGWVATQPDHILSASGNFTLLRVLVRSRQDTTLVIQKPDGSFFCNDDAEGRNPIIGAAFPAGNYRIYVGSYRAGRNPDYQLGFSELANVRTRDLR